MGTLDKIEKEIVRGYLDDVNKSLLNESKLFTAEEGDYLTEKINESIQGSIRKNEIMFLDDLKTKIMRNSETVAFPQ